MKLVHVAVGVLLSSALLAGGLIAAKPVPPAKPREAVLPSWAPKHPSKEFLRAAKVFKPIPPEVQAYDPLYVPAWEFFGTLTDQQVIAFMQRKQVTVPRTGMDEGAVERLKTHLGARESGAALVWYTHEVGIHFPSLSARQRRVFDSLVKAFPNEKMHRRDDLLVVLFRVGAKKDLSNVQVGFGAAGGHVVEVIFTVQRTTDRPGPKAGEVTSTSSVTTFNAGDIAYM